jgi:hypothetical protein
VFVSCAIPPTAIRIATVPFLKSPLPDRFDALQIQVLGGMCQAKDGELRILDGRFVRLRLHQTAR